MYGHSIVLPWQPYCSFTFVVFRRRAHGPCFKRIYTCPCTLPSPISTSCLYGLGKPLLCISYCTNRYLSLRASLYAFDLVSASCAPPPPTSSSPSPPLSPFVVSSPVSTTGAVARVAALIADGCADVVRAVSVARAERRARKRRGRPHRASRTSPRLRLRTNEASVAQGGSPVECVS